VKQQLLRIYDGGRGSAEELTPVNPPQHLGNPWHAGSDRADDPHGRPWQPMAHYSRIPAPQCRRYNQRL